MQITDNVHFSVPVLPLSMRTIMRAFLLATDSIVSVIVGIVGRERIHRMMRTRTKKEQGCELAVDYSHRKGYDGVDLDTERILERVLGVTMATV